MSYSENHDTILLHAGPTRAALASGAPAQRIHFNLGCLMYKSLSGQASQYLADDVQQVADSFGCDLPVTEPVSFHGLITVSATEASLLLDPDYGMLYLQNSDMTSALDSLGANWSRIYLSRALNHGALWHIVFLRLRNILTYLLTYYYYCCSCYYYYHHYYYYLK